MCVYVALGTQHAIRVRHIVVRGLPRSTKHFPHYLTNGTNFEKKSLNIKCVFRVTLQLLSETFLILGRTERDVIKNVYRSASQMPLFLSGFFFFYYYFSVHIFEKIIIRQIS